MPMNHVAEEIASYYGVSDSVGSLLHYGMPRRSGRYPWGSGDDPHQHGSRDFLGRIEELQKSGWTETPENIRKEFGLSTAQYRTEKAICKSERRQFNVARAKSLKEDGLSDTEIGRKMGVNESTVRGWFKESAERNMNEAKNTADFIKSQINKKGMVEVGKGVEKELNISKERMDQALYLIKRDGYPVYGGRVEQQTNPGKFTSITVACRPGTEHKEIFNYSDIHPLNEDNYISRDGGQTFDKYQYPKSMSSSRLKIRYAEEGGIDKDGVIEIRRGVDDISLGNDRYAQVRMLVDGTHYLKGMAVYSDDMPDGVDVVFNTNKHMGTPALGPKNNTVLKLIKNDPDNPFGALIKAGGQSSYIDKDGNKQLSIINKTRGEGDWNDWSNALPSQFLSKQSKHMAKKQLDLATADKMAEFEDICSLTNPTIKKHLLQKFSDECDAAAVDLKAAALPGQKYHVIIPISSLKDNEVYAPGYENGSQLALIRYPHGGTFEIPILTVNNKHAVAKKLLGTDVVDAVGINSKVAERLSGADFDGDTVMCIPTHDSAGKVKITSTPKLKGLEGFDPKSAYPEREGMRYMTSRGTQLEMGIVSNLITDMTLRGANTDEIARAVRHSMVVIDAEKHKLDYKQSEIDNGIAALKKKYQTGGASTLISRAKGEATVAKRQGSPRINQKGKEWYDPTKPEGAYIYKTADDLYYTPRRKEDSKSGKFKKGDPILNKDGTPKLVMRTQKSTKMAEVEDAYDLISAARTPMEIIYADYANTMKTLANRARKEMVYSGKVEYSSTAKATYAKEVESLEAKLHFAELNTSRERMAQIKTAGEISSKTAANPNMSKSDLKKARQQTLTRYRDEVGSISRKDRAISITDKEWEAIQAGAISEQKLKRILNNADIDALRERATPRTTTTLSPAKINRIKQLSNSNYSLFEIAKKMNMSTSTISNYLKEKTK